MSNEVLNPYQTFRDSTGAVVENGTLTFNVNETSTLDTIYSDEALTIAQDNPYTLDAAGRMTGDVRYRGKKRMILKDQSGATIRTLDHVVTASGLSTFSENYATLALAAAAITSADVGKTVTTSEHTAGYGYRGRNTYLVQAATSGWDNGSKIRGTTDNTVELLGLFPNGANVKQYGAGTAASVATNTAAFNAAFTNHSRVFVPPGDYEVQNVSGFTSNTEIFGSGWDCIVRQVESAGNDDHCFDIRHNADSGTTSVSGNLTNITIRGIQFAEYSGTPSLSEHSHLVAFCAVSDITFDGCFFNGFNGDGIYCGSGDSGTAERHNENFTVINCKFDGINKSNRNGISVIDCDGVLIEGNYFTRTSHPTMPGAVDIEPDGNVFHINNNVMITNNTFYDVGGNVGAVSVFMPTTFTEAPNGFLVEGNYFDSVGIAIYFRYAVTGGATNSTKAFGFKAIANTVVDSTSPFRVINGKGTKIINNDFINCADSGLLSFNSADDNCIDTTIKGNLFDRVGSSDSIGLSVFNADRLEIEGNEFNDCGDGITGYAIDFGSSATSSNVTIKNNHFLSPTGQTQNSIQVEGTHTLTPAGNICKDNRFNSLTNNFQADNTNEIIKTWTPVLTFATPGNLSVAYSAQVGRCLRDGAIVKCQFSIITSTFTHTTASGNLEITGLPYTSKNTANLIPVGSMEFQGITKASYTQVTPIMLPNTTQFILNASGSGQSLSPVTASNMPTGGSVVLVGSIQYLAE